MSKKVKNIFVLKLKNMLEQIDKFSGHYDVKGRKICKGDIVVECNNRYAHGVIIFDEKTIYDVEHEKDGLGGRTFKGWMVSEWHDVRRQEIRIYKELENGSDYEVVSNINEEKLENGKLSVVLSSGEELLIHRADGEVDCPKCGDKYNQATLITERKNSNVGGLEMCTERGEIVFVERDVDTWGWKIHTC